MNRKILGKGVEKSMSSGDEVHLVNPWVGLENKFNCESATCFDITMFLMKTDRFS